MATLNDLDKAREELEALSAYYKQFDKVRLPETFQQAIDEEWELDQTIADIGMKQAYNHEDKQADKVRCIKARDVLIAMQNLEAGIVEHAVVNPIDGVWKKVRFLELIAKLLYEHGLEIFKVARAVTKALLGKLWDSVVQLFYDPTAAFSTAVAAFAAAWLALISVSVVMLVSVIKQITRSFGGVNYVRTVRACFKQRDLAHKALLKKALPQRMNTRYFRRKETVR